MGKRTPVCVPKAGASRSGRRDAVAKYTQRYCKRNPKLYAVVPGIHGIYIHFWMKPGYISPRLSKWAYPHFRAERHLTYVRMYIGVDDSQDLNKFLPLGFVESVEAEIEKWPGLWTVNFIGWSRPTYTNRISYQMHFEHTSFESLCRD